MNSVSLREKKKVTLIIIINVLDYRGEDCENKAPQFLKEACLSRIYTGGLHCNTIFEGSELSKRKVVDWEDSSTGQMSIMDGEQV